MSEVVEIAVFTDDLEATKGFYAQLVGAAPEREWRGGAIFAIGHLRLLVHRRMGGVDGGPPDEDHFALAVPDLAAACEELRARGLTLLVEPREYPWGRSAYLRDPDGRLVELAEAPEPDGR